MPEFESKISLGTVLQTLGMICVLAVAWGKLVTKEELEAKITELRKDSVTKEVNTLQIQLLQRDVAAVSIKVEEIKLDVKDIKRIVRN